MICETSNGTLEHNSAEVLLNTYSVSDKKKHSVTRCTHYFLYVLQKHSLTKKKKSHFIQHPLISMACLHQSSLKMVPTVIQNQNSICSEQTRVVHHKSHIYSSIVQCSQSTNSSNSYFPNSYDHEYLCVTYCIVSYQYCCHTKKAYFYKYTSTYLI